MNNKIGIGIINTTGNDPTPLCEKIPLVESVRIESIDKSSTWTKNSLLYKLINDDCAHMFLIKDTITIKDSSVFDKYIETASKSGIWYLNYSNTYKVRNSIDYDGCGVSFADTINNQFCYYYKGILKNVGFFDERYAYGLLDQIDYTYRVTQKKLCPPWGWFADIENSNNYISAPSPGLIDNNQQIYWMENQWFKHRHKEFYHLLADTKEEDAIKTLEELKEQYAKII